MPLLIQLKQLNQVDLSGYVISCVTGNFSGLITPYVLNSGFLGNHIVYTTGGNQTVQGVKSFTQSPLVPYSGSSGSAVSNKYLLDSISALHDTINIGYLLKTGNVNENISGIKSFISSPTVPYPTTSGQAASKSYVDNLASTSLDFRYIRVSGERPFSGVLNISGVLNLTGIASDGNQSRLNFFDAVNVGIPIELTPVGRWLVINGLVSGDDSIWFNSLNGSIENFNPDAGISFLSGSLYDSSRVERINWLNRTLSGRWTATSGFNISGNNVITGAVFRQGVGGTSVNGVIIISGSGMNVSGSSQIFNPRLTGINGINVIRSGDNTILISGIANSYSSLTVTGSSTILSPNLIGINGVRTVQSGSNVLVSGESLNTLNVLYYSSGLQDGVNFQPFLYPSAFSVTPRIYGAAISHQERNDIINYQISGRSTTGFFLVYSTTVPAIGYEFTATVTTGNGFYSLKY